MFTLKSKHLIALVGATMLTTMGSLIGAPLQTTSTAEPAADSKQKALPPGFTKGEIDKLSEAFGHFIGRNLNNPGVHFDLDSTIRGIRAGYAGQPAPMSDQEYTQLMTKLQESAFTQLSEENLKAANAYLEKNKSASGIVEVEPGKLQYIILQSGKGAEVKGDGVPQINYVGKYIDGTVFGSSEEVGGPITIPLGQTIKGFSKGLAGMKEGEKRRLFVHPDLGYGTSGQLPPNALLIFDIEIVKADTPDYKKNALSKDSLTDSLNDDDDDDSDDDSDDDDDDDDSKGPLF